MGFVFTSSERTTEISSSDGIYLKLRERSLERLSEVGDVASLSPLERLVAHASLLETRPLASDALLGNATFADLAELSGSLPNVEPELLKGPRAGEPALTSSRVGIRATSASDADAVSNIVNDPTIAWRLPTRGTFVRPALILDQLAQSHPHLAVGVELSTGKPISLLSLSALSERNSVGEISFYSLRQSTNPYSGMSMECLVLYLSFLFNSLGLRKLQAQILERDLKQFDVATDILMQQEGILRDHVRVGSCYQDVHVFAIWRVEWLSLESEIQGLLMRWV